MDLEKHHAPTKELDDLLNDQQSPRTVYKTERRRRLRKAVVHSAGLLAILLLIVTVTHRGRSWNFWGRKISLPHFPRHQLSLQEREELFLSIPTGESALEVSRAYATHPHLAGSSEDLLDAKTILHLFQDEFDIPRSTHLPIYDAGSPLSRNATLLLTTPDAPSRPRAWIDTYYPVMNTGVEQALEILDDQGNAKWSADLVEDGDPRDEDAHKYRDTIPPWHGYSADGDVTGQLIYANYGDKEDYDELLAQGTNFTGKIVITRYGVNFRGIKIQGAELLGAAGVLIYSDPRDDGFVTTKNDFPPYPAGPARNPSSIQRGSVQYLSTYPGDPSTPGFPAYPDVDRTEGGNVPKIPSLPISWQNAQKLLGEIDGLYTRDVNSKKVLSGNPSKSNIRLVNRVDTKVTPIWNAMASIPGHIKNEVVVIGCHRDAWVMGAADPTSGTVSLHEIIRGYGALLGKGWKPLRTIVIASWDGEEYGLVGSVEWGEDFGSWISEHVVAYLNVDVSVAGSQFVVAGSPSLAHLIEKTANDVPHPTVSGKTLWDALDDDGPYHFQGGNATIDPDFLELYTSEQVARRAYKTRVTPLGSGSDFTVFLQRLGIASSEQSFSPSLNDAVYHYHSIYDSQSWQERYGDPGFHRHAAVAKHLGLLGLRLTDAIILPINTTQYALELHQYLDVVEKLLPTLGEKMHEVNFASLRQSIQQVQEASFELDEEKFDAEEDFKRLLKRMPFPGRRGARCTRRRSGLLRRAADWVKSVFGVPPPTDSELQLLSLRHANSWEEYLEYATDADGDAELFESLEVHPEEQNGHGLPFPIREFIKAAKRVARANKALKSFELGFISEHGIKNREWYKHLGVAPGKWLGYGATTLPALTEAIVEEKNTTLIQYEAKRLETLLVKLASTIKPETSIKP